MACILAGLSLCTAAQASPFLSVDFNGNNGPTQAGFQAFSEGNADLGITSDSRTYSGSALVNAPAPVTSVGVNISTSGGSGAGQTNLFARDRGTVTSSDPTFTQSSLIEDWVGGGTIGNAPATNGPPFVVAISGLAASTPYSFTFWVFDAGNQGSEFITDQNSQNLGTISWAAGNSTAFNNSSVSLTARTITDGTGTATFTIEANGGGTSVQGRGLLNGFTVSTVPEPAFAGLAAIIAAGTLGRRRRRTA